MREELTAAMKDAMKAKDSLRLATIRLIQAAIKDRDIAERTAGKGELADDAILALLAKMVKSREESAKIYSDNARPELAEKENAEIAIIKSFMPEQIADDKVAEIIAGVIAETGAAGLKDMGKVIAVLRERYAGQMDFAKASGLVKEQLK